MTMWPGITAAAANWDRREQADALSLDAALADGDIVVIMDEVIATDHPAQFLVSPALEREDGFRRLVMNPGANSANDASVALVAFCIVAEFLRPKARCVPRK